MILGQGCVNLNLAELFCRSIIVSFIAHFEYARTERTVRCTIHYNIYHVSGNLKKPNLVSEFIFYGVIRGFAGNWVKNNPPKRAP